MKVTSLHQTKTCSGIILRMFREVVQSSFCSSKLKSHKSAPAFRLSDSMKYPSWLVLSVLRRAPLCRPLLTMRSVCAVLLALAAAALASADSDTHSPRHDSNLEICILLLLVCRAAVKCSGGGWLDREPVHAHEYISVSFFFFKEIWCMDSRVSVLSMWKVSMCPPDLLLCQTSGCLRPRGKISWMRSRIWWSWTTSISSTRS